MAHPRPYDGKLGIVTGGSRGIGAAVARRLAAKGCHLLLVFTSESSKQPTQQLCEELSSAHQVRCTCVQADLSGAAEAARKVVDAAESFFATYNTSGRFQVDMLVNNAGVSSNQAMNDPALGPIAADEFTRVYSINVLGPLLLTQAVAPFLPRDRSGRIVNVSSVSSSIGYQGQSVYAGSKAALEAMTRTWSRELAERATVNAVNPGPAWGDMYAAAGEAFWRINQPYVDAAPLAGYAGERAVLDMAGADAERFDRTVREGMGGRRPGFAGEIAGTIDMLCSAESGWTTGSVAHQRRLHAAPTPLGFGELEARHRVEGKVVALVPEPIGPRPAPRLVGDATHPRSASVQPGQPPARRQHVRHVLMRSLYTSGTSRQLRAPGLFSPKQPFRDPPLRITRLHDQQRVIRLRHTRSASPAMASTIDLGTISADSDGSPLVPKIRGILSAAVNDLPPTAQSAERTAGELDALYPAGDTQAVEGFLWALWSLLIGVAQKIPADDPRQQLLAQTVQELVGKRDDEVVLWNQTTRVWSELPMLGPCMREAWDLSPMYDGSDGDNAAIQEWISLNSFAARILGANLQTWVNLAIWEFRSGLEEPPPPSQAAKDTALATACEWITHAGKALHEQGGRVQQLDAMEQRALKPGKLFENGKPGLSDERWRFWRERMGVMGAGAGSGELKERAQRAVERMKELEGSA
ncbi:Putative oxidoreductase [Tolypocladium paradoxum]|uniref:Oxidoreductase n=1 Tax=Tolypocladium paradoxum TaxID=94208 RepID=A0A2S4KYE3_9HYPO|nr:Putative oxidoreductase [Tolypocladium paradoxum]